MGEYEARVERCKRLQAEDVAADARLCKVEAERRAIHLARLERRIELGEEFLAEKASGRGKIKQLLEDIDISRSIANRYMNCARCKKLIHDAMEADKDLVMFTQIEERVVNPYIAQLAKLPRDSVQENNARILKEKGIAPPKAIVDGGLATSELREVNTSEKPKPKPLQVVVQELKALPKEEFDVKLSVVPPDIRRIVEEAVHPAYVPVPLSPPIPQGTTYEREPIQPWKEEPGHGTQCFLTRLNFYGAWFQAMEKAHGSFDTFFMTSEWDHKQDEEVYKVWRQKHHDERRYMKAFFKSMKEQRMKQID